MILAVSAAPGLSSLLVYTPIFMGYIVQDILGKKHRVAPGERGDRPSPRVGQSVGSDKPGLPEEQRAPCWRPAGQGRPGSLLGGLDALRGEAGYGRRAAGTSRPPRLTSLPCATSVPVPLPRLPLR